MDLGISAYDLRFGLVYYLVFLGSLCVREYARAYTIDRLGDPNPAAQGLVSMHPMAHLSWLGTLIFPLICIFGTGGVFVFGWGKGSFPNPSYFKHPRLGEILVALSGSLANLGVALVASVLCGVIFPHYKEIQEVYERILFCNVIFIVFNLIPIPPRDGGVLLKNLIGMSNETFLRISQWGYLFWLALIIFPQSSRVLTLCMLGISDQISVIFNFFAK